LLVQRLLQGRPRKQVAAEFGVIVKTGHTWLARFQSEGSSGLDDRSCQPRQSPQVTVRELDMAVLALRRRRRRVRARGGGALRHPRGDHPRGANHNGSCCRSREFAQACRELGLIHRFTRPYTRTNGQAKRFI
jgi:hypothetical protein